MALYPSSTIVGFVCGDMKEKYSQFVVFGIEHNVSTDLDLVT